MFKRTLWVLAFTGLLSGVTLAQAPRQPANMTTIPVIPSPQQSLQVLDPTGAWVPVGTINPANHSFFGNSGGFQYQTHAALLEAVKTAPSPPQAIGQQGFYAPGGGSDAVYQWSAASWQDKGTSASPGLADGLGCILPAGQSPSTAGRYLLSTNGEFNVRWAGLQPGRVRQLSACSRD